MSSEVRRPAVENQVDSDSLKNDVYVAACYGDMEKMRRLVESEGASVAEPDPSGYYPLQWAALNNKTAVAQYIIEPLVTRKVISSRQQGGDVNSADQPTGQTAVHWSAVRGSIQVAELLLREGALVNAVDTYGYQPIHIAAQYGQTAFLYYLVSSWNAESDVLDNEGRTPLHWAAYKGFPDCIHLLLRLDAYRIREDIDGRTPLHWAACKGNLEACVLLVQAGKEEDLMMTGDLGRTPSEVASDNDHRKVAFFLYYARELLHSRRNGNSRFGCLTKSKLASLLRLTIPLLLLIFITSVHNQSANFPKLTAGTARLAWSGVFLASTVLIMFYRYRRNIPGFSRTRSQHPPNMEDNELVPKVENLQG